MSGFITMLLALMGGMCLVTFLLSLFKVRWPKYVLPILFVVLAFVCFVMSLVGVNTGVGGWGDLILVLASFIFGITGLAGLLFAVFLDIRKRRVALGGK